MKILFASSVSKKQMRTKKRSIKDNKGGDEG